MFIVNLQTIYRYLQIFVFDNPYMTSLFGSFSSLLKLSNTMALETMFEKLQFTDEKNLLIQGLPSTIEKQFSKINFCKSVTPLLRTRKIDFALVFAVSRKQLTDIVNEVAPALQDNAKFWVATPKISAKIASDLCRYVNWDMITSHGYEPESQVVLDNVWSAMKFRKIALQPKLPARSKRVAAEMEI